MVVVCPVCRDVVHEHNGCLVRHGSKYHGEFKECAGSGTPYFCDGDCFCGD